MAGFAQRVWQLEQPVQAISSMGQERRVRESFQCHEWRAGPGICPYRRDDCSSSSEGFGRKRGTQHQAIGRSRGGLTTKVVALVDALGNLFRFLLLPGQAHDMKGVAPLIKGASFGRCWPTKPSTPTGSCKTLMSVAQPLSSRPNRTEKFNGTTIPTCTSGAISSKTISQRSRNSEA